MKLIFRLLGCLLALSAAASAWSAPAVRTVPSCTKMTVNSTIDVAAGTTFDGVAKYGKWICFVGNSSTMPGDQTENQVPVFKLNNGATLKNVVIGDGSLGTGTNLAAGGGDGVHCYGVCNITNAYWADIGEDAATLKYLSGVTGKLTISGGAAFKGKDKTFQNNGNGSIVITDFYANNIGKLYRSCGNCSKQYARKLTISSVTLGTVNSAVVGVNSSFDSTTGIQGQYDVATFTDLSYAGSKKKCATFVGNASGAEPPADTSTTNIARSCVFK